jgi:hypothetical protein
MRACRPSWCASGHRQPVRRPMNGAPSAVWSSTWPHGVGRRSTGSSTSSLSFAAASRRPRRSCQRSSTRSDQDRPRRHRRPAHCGGEWAGRRYGSDRADITWRLASDGVLINEGWEAELPAWWDRILAALLRPLNEALVVGSRARGGTPRPVGRPGEPDRASGPRRGGQPRAARACGIRSRWRSLRDL